MKPMESLPDWENDPIETICAPVSGCLVTRMPLTLYGLTVRDFTAGREFKLTAKQRVRNAQRLQRHKARKRKG